MSISMEFKGYNRVANMLRLLASEMASEVVDPVLGEWTKDVRYDLKAEPYPPKRPKQIYVRTGQIANRWRAEQVKPGVWRIVNDAVDKYGRFYAFRVVGDAQGDGQAWMHEGRWWLVREVVDGYTDDLTQRLSKDLEDYWRLHG